MQRNVVLGGGVCENPKELSLDDCPMETVEYIWMNIWCMLDWFDFIREILKKLMAPFYGQSSTV